MQDAVRYQWADEATRLLKDRQDARALEILDKLIAAYPGREDLLVSKAYCLSRLGQHDDAAAIHRRLSESAAPNDRVQRLGLFISKRAAPVFELPAASKEPEAPAFSIAVPPVLARKLEVVRQGFEQELETFRGQHAESAAAIERLRTRLAERENAVVTLTQKNEELESLLTGLSNEMAGLHTPSSPVLTSDVTLSQEEIRGRLETAERQIQERDDTLSAIFRKNGDLERTIRRLTAELEELRSESAAGSDTETELRAELQKARSEALEARHAATEFHGLRAALRTAEDGVDAIETERDAVRDRIAELEEQLEKTFLRETRALELNRTLESRAADQEGMLGRAAQALQALEAQMGRFDAGRTAGQATFSGLVSRISGELSDLRTTLGSMVAERVALADRLSAVETEYAALHAEYTALERRRDEMQVEMDSRRSDITLALDRRKELNDALAAAERRMSAIAEREQELHARIGTLHHSIVDRDALLESSRIQTARLESDLHEARMDRDSLAVRESELRADSEALAAALVKERSAIQELRDAKARIENAFNELKIDFSALAEAAGAAGEEIALQREAREVLLLERAATARKLDETQSALQQALSERDALRASLAGLEVRENDLAGRWNDSEARLREALGTLNARERELNALARERDDLGAQLAALQRNIEALLESGRSRDSEILRLQGEIDERRAAFVQVDEQKTGTELTLSHLKMEHAYLAKQEREAREKIEALAIELGQRDMQIADLGAGQEHILRERAALQASFDALAESERQARKSAADLARDLDAARESLAQAADTRCALEAEAERREEELVWAAERESTASVRIQELTGMIAQQAGRIGELEADHVSLLAERARKESQAVALEQTYRAATDEIASLSAQLHKAERELAELRIQRAQLEAEEDRLLSEISGLRNVEQQIRRRAELLDSELQDRNRRVAGLETEIAEQDGRLVDLAHELREREDRLREIEQERFLLNERVGVLDAELPPLRERETSLDAQVAELQGALCDEQESLRMRGEELATALRRVEDMRTMVATSEQELAEAARVRADMETARNGVEAGLTDARAAHDAAEARIRELQQQIALLESDLADVTEHSHQTEIRAEQLEGALHERDKVIDDARYQLQQARDTIHRLQPELDRIYTQELPQALEQKVSALRRMQDLRAEIELLRSQMW